MDTTNSATNNQQNTASPRRIRRFIDLFRSPDDNTGFEKQRKQAIYNLIAFTAFLFLILTVICCYFILQQFLRPLLWALMFGFVLFPFKRRVNLLILNYITRLNDTHRPAILEVFFLPFNLINYCLTKVSKIIIQYGKLLGFIFFALLFIHLALYYFIFAHKIWTLITSAFLSIFNLLKLVQSHSNLYVLITLAVAHFGLLCFQWNEDTKHFLIKSTPVIWISLLCKIILLFNTLGTLFVVLLISMLAIGVLAKFYGIKNRASNGDQTDDVNRLRINLNLIKVSIWNFILSLLPSHNDEDDIELISDDSIDQSIEDSVTDKSFIGRQPVDASSPLFARKDISVSAGDSVDTQTDKIPKESLQDQNKSTQTTFRSTDKSYMKKSLRTQCSQIAALIQFS